MPVQALSMNDPFHKQVLSMNDPFHKQVLSMNDPFHKQVLSMNDPSHQQVLSMNDPSHQQAMSQAAILLPTTSPSSSDLTTMDIDEPFHHAETVMPNIEDSTYTSEPAAASEGAGTMDVIMSQLTKESPDSSEHLMMPEVQEETQDDSDHLMMRESKESSDSAGALVMPNLKEGISDEDNSNPVSDEGMPAEQTPDKDTPDEHIPDEHIPDAHTPDAHTPNAHTPNADLVVQDEAGKDEEDENEDEENGGHDGEDDENENEDEEKEKENDGHDGDDGKDENYLADEGDDSDQDSEDYEDEDDDQDSQDSTDEEATVVGENESGKEAKPAASKKPASIQVVIPFKKMGNSYFSKSQIASAGIHSSLPNHNEPAKMHSKSTAYTIQHTLTSAQPFSMIAHTLTSGPYAGRVAWVADPDTSSKFKFLELPPEVRNMIYDLLFVRHDSKVTFAPTKMSNQGDGAASDLVGSWKWTRTGVHRKSQDWYIKGLGLLATCKELREEAAGVVYGSNAFEFQRTTTLKHFLATIGGRNRMLIRNINTGWIIQKDAKAAAKLLLDCKQLETLHLDLSYMTAPPFTSLKTPETVVPLFRSVLKQMFAYLYGKHTRSDSKTKEKTFSFLRKDRVTWELLGDPSRETAAEKVTRRECNKQMRAKILEVTNSKKVIAAHQSSVKKRMAALERKEAATARKRVAAQKVALKQKRMGQKVAKKKVVKQKSVAKKAVAKKPATSAQPAVGKRITRSQGLAGPGMELD